MNEYFKICVCYHRPAFLFDVLQKLDVFCKDDYAKLSVEQQRILGYAAENIWGIYWRYLKNRLCEERLWQIKKRLAFKPDVFLMSKSF